MSIETEIEELTNAYVSKLNSLATGGYLREGVLKEAVTALIWGIYEAMPDQRLALAEALENWPDLLLDAHQEDRKDAAP